MKNIVRLSLSMIGLLTVTTLIVLYSDGWRFNFNDKEKDNLERVVKTGMLAMRSIPEGAQIYIDDNPVTATDDTISSLTPKQYKIKLIKEGFETWEKDVEVYPELVTDITAVLVLMSPRLEPLTNTDVKAYALSSNGNNIAFLTKNHEKPGVWVLPMNGTPLNIFSNNAQLLIADNSYGSPSLGEQIWWSPNDKEILVKMNETGYLLYELSEQNNVNVKPTSITDVKEVLDRWHEEWINDFYNPKVESLKDDNQIPQWIKESVPTIEQTWSPDDSKFFFTRTNPKNNQEKEVIVYNSEKPLPVGEERLYTSQTISAEDAKNTVYEWFSDSYHLIKVKRDPQSLIYTVSLVRIDGTNETIVYTGTLSSNQAYPSPGGDKVIVLTSLKDNSPNNLYAIAIR